MATIRYVESGYIEAGYFQVVVEPNAISLTVTSTVSCNAEEFLAATRYVEEGYWNAGYTETIKYLDPLTLATAVTISADLTEVTETEGSATLSSSFGLTSNSGLLLTIDGDDSTSLSVASTVSSTAVKTVDAQADFGALFTPSITTGTIKVITATLVSSISMNATVSKFSGNEATLSNIVNLSLQGVKTAVFDSALSTSFTQSSTPVKTASTDATFNTTSALSFQGTTNALAEASLSSEFATSISAQIHVRNTSATITNSSYITFDASNKKFGTHSLSFTNGTYVQPDSNVLYVGSTYYSWGTNFVWTSTNGTSWTRTSTNLNITFNSPYLKIVYLNSLFILRDGGTIYSSSDGITWTSDTTTVSSYSSSSNFHRNTIAWDGSYYYLGGGFSNQWRVGKTSSITSLNITTHVGVFNSTGSGDTYNIRGVTQNGNNIAWLIERRINSTNLYYVSFYDNSSGGTLDFVVNGSQYERVSSINSPINYINGSYHILTHNFNTGDHKVYTTANGNSFTSGTSFNINNLALDYMDYFDSKYIIGGTTGRFAVGSSINNLAEATNYVNYRHTSVSPGAGAHDGSNYIFSDANGSFVTYDGNSFSINRSVTDSELTPQLVISRGDNTDFGTWKTIDFNVYQTSNSGLRLFQLNPVNSTSTFNWSILAPNNTNASLSVGNSNNHSAGNNIINNQWNHIRIVNDSGVSVWINGTRYINQQSFGLDSIGREILIETPFGAVQIDELLVSDDALSSHSEATITVPTTAYENGLNTDLLMHFDNTLNDDSRFSDTVDPSATITAVASVTADLTYVIANGAASISSASNVVANTDVVRTATATITSSTSVSATGLRIKDSGSITCNTASTVGVTAVKQVTASSSANLLFTSQIDAGLIKTTGADFDSINTLISVAVKIGDFFVNADSAFTQTANPNFIGSGVATLTSDFAQTTNETLFKSFSATLTTNSSVAVTVNTIIDPTANLTSAFDTSTTGDRIRFGVGSFASVFNLSADNSTTKDFNAVLTSSFNLPAVDCNRTRPFVATVTSATTVDATVIKIVDAESTVDVAVSVTDVTPSVTRTLEAELPSVATQLTAVAKIGDFLIDADVASSLTIIARKTTGNVIVATVDSTLTSDISLTKQGISSLDSAITVDVEGTSNITGEADFDIVASVESTPVKIVTADATLSGEGGFDVTAVASRNNEIIMISNFTQTADGNRIRFGIVNANVVVTGSFTAGKRVSVTSVINSNITISADVRVINIDDIVYKIPAETREYSIVSEAREHTIVKETREHIVT